MLSAKEEVRVRSHRPRGCCCCCCWVGAVASGLARCCCLPVVPWHNLCRCHFCVDKDGGASLMSFPPPHSFPSPSASMHNCHIHTHYIPAALAKPLVCCCTLTMIESWGVKTAIEGMVTQVKTKNIFWPRQLCGTRNTCSTCLIGQGDVILPLHSASQTESSLAPPHSLSSRVFPLYLPRSSSPFPIL